jgi:prolyl 4-hydroxylase
MVILLLSQVYKEGSVLLPHVDDLPLVCSAIINVAQSVEEPWPLEVYGRDGMAVNITMSPGDIVLYESHSLIHGRPFPLMGKYYSNVFIHFEPQQEENAVFQPPYFVPGTPKELVDLYYTQGRAGTNGYSGEVAREVVEKLDDWSSDEEDWAPAHYAAYRGDTEALKKYLKEQKVKVNERDDDGWTLLAYAAHSGHVKTVRFLVESGANVDIIIFEDEDNGEEVTAHEIARRNWGDDSEIVRFLSSAN